jgi:ArsR family transcriptional regulator
MPIPPVLHGALEGKTDAAVAARAPVLNLASMPDRRRGRRMPAAGQGLIASHPGGEACVCDLTGAFDLAQPTISHHLKVLHEAGLLDRDKRGVWVCYQAHTEALASLGALIGDQSA